MISLAKPTLKQQAEIAIQTELGGWFANPKLGSELHRAGTLKTTAKTTTSCAKACWMQWRICP